MNNTLDRMSIGVFDVVIAGDTAIVTPRSDLREFEFEAIETGTSRVLAHLRRSPVTNLVLDFGRTDCCGSTALGSFIRFWKLIRSRGGRMALCNVSEHEKEILRVTNLDGLWPICASLEEAIRTVGAGA